MFIVLSNVLLFKKILSMMRFQRKTNKKYYTVLLPTDKETYIFPAFKSKPNNASLGET